MAFMRQIDDQLSELNDVLEASRHKPGHEARLRLTSLELDKVIAQMAGGTVIHTSPTSPTQASSYEINLTGTCPHCKAQITLTAP
jgi:hypothetical protein